MATKKKKSEPRKKIPISTQLKLWVNAGGRCQFPGCNKSLLKDNLTLKEDNYSNIAHIVASSKDWCRGHETLSKDLAADYSNLMLMCATHHKLIDGKNCADYPVEVLQLYKAQQEGRIRVQTEIQDDHTTTVLRFMSKIGPQPLSIPLAQTYKAIYPHYPADEKGILIDLTKIDIEDKEEYWTLMATQIRREVTKHFDEGNDGKKVSRVSVFAIGAIPLLMQLGYAIGNIVPMEIYNRHRDTQDWMWKTETPKDFTYEVHKPQQAKGNKVSLILSLSGKIQDEELTHLSNFSTFQKYEMTIPAPDPGFLKSASQLEQFRSMYRTLITEIREKHGADCTIHVVPAIPAPIAVICGKELLLRVDPTLVVYQKNQTNGKFIPVLTLNNKNA